VRDSGEQDRRIFGRTGCDKRETSLFVLSRRSKQPQTCDPATADT
jgi:hypothetical protein